MTNADRAKTIREAIFARADEEGGAVSREQMEDAIRGALDKMAAAAMPAPLYVVTVGDETVWVPTPIAEWCADLQASARAWGR